MQSWRPFVPVLFVAAACSGDTTPDGRIGVFDATSPLDVLFVVDTAGPSSGSQQLLLQEASQAFLDELSRLPDGFPSVHLGVTTGDMGAGPYNLLNCAGRGDAGTLSPGPLACPSIEGSFIRDVDDGEAERARNYTGSLAEAFGCTLDQGSEGCEFQQPMAAMRAALDGSNPINAGFLRDDAALLVVLFTNQEDCSASDDAVFDTSQTDLDDPLGPLGGFRCFDFGVDCDTGNDDPRAPGPRAGCRARADSPYFHVAQLFADFLAELKPEPARVGLSTIVGATEPVVVELVPSGQRQVPTIQRTCDLSSALSAKPSIRISSLVDQFPGPTAVSSICAEDLSPAMQTTAQLAGALTSTRCLTGSASTPEALETTCTVADVIGLDGPDETRQLLTRCSIADAASPCFRFVASASCPQDSAGVVLELERRGTTARAGSKLVVECGAR